MDCWINDQADEMHSTYRWGYATAPSGYNTGYMVLFNNDGQGAVERTLVMTGVSNPIAMFYIHAPQTVYQVVNGSSVTYKFNSNYFVVKVTQQWFSFAYISLVSSNPRFKVEYRASSPIPFTWLVKVAKVVDDLKKSF